MSKFENYLKTFDIGSTLTEEDMEKTMALLQIYGPTVRGSMNLRKNAMRAGGNPFRILSAWRLTMTVIQTVSAFRTALRRWVTVCSCCLSWKKHWYW